MDKTKLTERELEMIKKLVPLACFSVQKSKECAAFFDITTMELCSMTREESQMRDHKMILAHAKWASAQRDYYSKFSEFMIELAPDFMMELKDRVGTLVI